jgi:hypothetical protein
MPIRLDVPLEKEYFLEDSDKMFNVEGEPTRVTIRQATQGEHETRAALFSQVIREMARDSSQEDVIRLIQRFSFEELKRIEVKLTMKACNIVGPDGKLLFKFGSDGRMSDHLFKEAWDSLPPSVASEIHDKVLDLNIDWRPQLGEDS